MKHLVQTKDNHAIKHLGMPISYDEMIRIDSRLTEREIQEVSEFRVPVGQ